MKPVSIYKAIAYIIKINPNETRLYLFMRVSRRECITSLTKKYFNSSSVDIKFRRRRKTKRKKFIKK